MSWLAVWLIGIAVADLAHSVRPVRRLPGVAGALALVGVGLLAGLTDPRDLLALAAMALSVVLWDHFVRHGFGTGRAWLPLAWLATCFVLLVAFSPAASSANGAVGWWLDDATLGWLDFSPDEALLLLGVMGVQCSTGNVVVRLVLRATDTLNPARGADHDATRTLKGGRLLGPMERVFIVGMGLTGNVTAAGIVIAAKGLLRWPELQARRDATEGPSIDEVTEYFLVGSFVSWLWALSGLVLLA